MRKEVPETILDLNEKPAYIESKNGGYYIAGTRISLESVVHQFREGLSPETIQHECFPALTLEQVYGACTYYLRHRDAVEKYLQEAGRDFERLGADLETEFPGIAHQREHLSRLRERTARPSSTGSLLT